MTAKDRRGAMLLEYVILVTSLAIVVFAGTRLFYDPLVGGFGKLGKPVLYLFQRLVTVISLPVP